MNLVNEKSDEEAIREKINVLQRNLFWKMFPYELYFIMEVYCSLYSLNYSISYLKS